MDTQRRYTSVPNFTGGKKKPLEPTPSDGLSGHAAYQQRLEHLKVRISELSHRNMDNNLRILRTWMNQI